MGLRSFGLYSGARSDPPLVDTTGVSGAYWREMQNKIGRAYRVSLKNIENAVGILKTVVSLRDG